MSLLTTTKRAKGLRTRIPPLTNVPGDHSRWKSKLQDLMFELFRNVNMDELTSAQTLDEVYFKKTSPFKEQWRTADTDSKESNDEGPLDRDTTFSSICLKYALSTGMGFHV